MNNGATKNIATASAIGMAIRPRKKAELLATSSRPRIMCRDQCRVRSRASLAVAASTTSVTTAAISERIRTI